MKESKFENVLNSIPFLTNEQLRALFDEVTDEMCNRSENEEDMDDPDYEDAVRRAIINES